MIRENERKRVGESKRTEFSVFQLESSKEENDNERKLMETHKNTCRLVLFLNSIFWIKEKWRNFPV